MNPLSNLTVTGIDLGSSAVKIAAVLKGGVEIITNQANFRQTPNVVGFGEKQRFIGQAGQLKIKSNHSNTVVSPSRFLGVNEKSPYLDQQLKFCPAKPKKSQNQKQTLKFNLLYGKQRQSFSIQQIVAAYLTQIQKIIGQTNNLSNKNMVITVPSYFSQHQRKALVDAIEITKKKMNNNYPTQIVEQQIATSMDYGFSKRNDFSEDLQKAKKVLFIDFGHSKTSLYVTAFNKQHMRIMANKFQRQLGCKFMDEQLVKFYAQKFDQSHPNMELNLLQSKKSVLKLLQNVQKQRKVLSGNLQHDLSIQCLLQDQDLFYSMKRDQYEKICTPVIQKFRQMLTNFSNQLKQKGITFQTIELIGGGTRIPIIINTIAQVFGHQPSRTINSNECVARGAALISAMNSSIFRVQPYSFFSISPYIINLKVNGQALDKKIIQNNQLLVKDKSIEFQIDKCLEKITLLAEYQHIQEGIQKRIFECQVSINKKQLKNEQNNIQMKDQSEQNQRIKLTLNIKFDQYGLVILNNITSNHQQFSVKMDKANYFSKFTTEQLNQMQLKQKNMTINDLKIKKFYEKKNQFQSFVYKTKHQIENYVLTNSQYISELRTNQMKKLIENQQNWLASLETGSQIRLQDFSRRSQELNKNVQQIFNSINQLKQLHSTVNNELQKLANFLNDIINKRGENQYPDQVNKAGQWINQVFERQKKQPKFNTPVITIEQLQQIYQNLVHKINQFDQQMQRKRQANIRKRQYPQQRNQQYQRPNYSNFNSYGGRSPYEQEYYRPRTTRNNRNNYNSNPFGSFFGNSGFSGFF